MKWSAIVNVVSLQKSLEIGGGGKMAISALRRLLCEKQLKEGVEDRIAPSQKSSKKDKK